MGLQYFTILVWLVVDLPTPLKNDGVSNSWDDDIPNCWTEWENKIPWFQSPPTRLNLHVRQGHDAIETPKKLSSMR